MRPVRIRALAPLEVLSVVAIRPFEPHRLRIPLESENVCGDTIEKPPIVRDHHGTTGEIDERFLQRSQSIDIEIIRRLVEQQEIPTRLEQLGKMKSVSLSARETPNFLLLIRSLEVELRQIRSSLHLALSNFDDVVPLAHFLVDGVCIVELTRLIEIRELHGVSDRE